MAQTQTFTCPECGAEFSVNEVLHKQIDAEVRQQYERDREALAAKQADIAQQAQELEAAKKDADKAIKAAVAQKLSELEQEKEKLESLKRDTEHTIAVQVKEKLAASEKALRGQIKQEAETEQKAILDMLREQLAEKELKLQESRKQEAEFLKKKAELEEQKNSLEIDKLKQIEAAKEGIKTEAELKAAEQYQLILAQKDKQLADAVKQAEDLKRKAEQGSQKMQGEVLELTLEARLREAFAQDAIAPVPAGVRGADIIQQVYNPQGKECGQIIWETKNTKNWAKDWIQKLKDDQRELRADAAIIVSAVLPEGITDFAPLDGVWVCDRRFAVPLAALIRDKLEAIAREKNLAVGKNEKMEILYQYLTGIAFRQRIEAIVENFSAMQDDLAKEKRYYAKKWANTEKRLGLVLKNTVGMYGDLEAMVALPKIPALELEFKPEADGAE